ncbi:UbiA family prenyltransferase [Alisedimentitalea sp. MJ-SS2]|uniref:UbiA family prenyltransferase n=1 Tax=Aliisedimentitalea sp. MJ-SS2 TaxID=3049795 RepID=UPI00290BC9C7|nr:UbiA family prenyltransferase [Alisedimentitalea sp. MJ-SS2]MDU8926096.1 UbiA family prenyltransferase [Alisedimentitalea sp. MJ-SS2]
MSNMEPLVLRLAGGFLRTDPSLERRLDAITGDGVLRADLLPVSDAALAKIEAARTEGRQVLLCSKGDARLAEELATLHGLDGVSDAPGQAVAQGWHPRDMARALRPHQWVKNILLLLPLLAAHRFEWAAIAQVLLGMVAFSAAASSIYVVNDLLDLEADRLHEKKCKRPFASGAVPIRAGVGAFFVLVALALGLGAMLGPLFVVVTVFYVALSIVYSFRLKRARWVDIGTLASLYTIRVVAGAAAVQVESSIYMVIFVFPVFLTLGAVKRLTELTLAKNDDPLPGRGYGRPDRGKLLNLSMLGMLASLVVFFLYTMSDQARALYPDRWILWLAMIPLAGWLFRMVRLGFYGKQDYDPIVFAMRDKRGLGLIMITLALMWYAAGLWAKWLGL